MTQPAGAGPLDNTPFFSVYGGYLFNESGDSVDFQSDGPPLGPFTDTILDPLGQLGPGEDGGAFGLEFGAPINPNWDWRIGINGAVFSDDTSSDTTFGITSGARSALNYEYLDLELGYRPGVMPDMIRLFAGPRVLRAATELNYETDGLNKVGTYDRDVELWGVGARAGAEAAIPLGASRASISLLGAGSALYAQSDADYSFDFTGNSTGFGNVSTSDDRGVYNFEARAALNFAATDRIDFQVGYQVQQWWDLTTTFDAVESTDTAITDTGRGDVLVHGPFARVTIKLGGPKQP